MKLKKLLKIVVSAALVSLCLSGALFLVSCTVVPKPVINHTAGIDSSVPQEYVKINGGDNGGFLFYDANKNGYISDGLKSRYNLLIKKYRIKYREIYLVDLAPDMGVSSFMDQWGNKIWKLERTYVKALILLNGMQNDTVEPDSGWDKALDIILSH